MYDGGAAFGVALSPPEPNAELGPVAPVSGVGSVPAGVESRFDPGVPNDELAPGALASALVVGVAGFVGMNGSTIFGVAGVVPGVPESGFVVSVGVVPSAGFAGVAGFDVSVPDLPGAPVPEVAVEDGPVPDGVVPEAPVPDAEDPDPAAEPAPAPPLDPAPVPLWANAKPHRHTPARHSVIHCRLEIMARRSGRIGMDRRARAGTGWIALPDAHEPRNCLIFAQGGERVKGIEPS